MNAFVLMAALVLAQADAGVARSTPPQIGPKPVVADSRDGGSALGGASGPAGVPAVAVAPARMDPGTQKLVNQMQAFYERTQDFTAHFEQSYTYATFNRTQKSSGEVLFKKPGFMRWNYEAPAKKTFVLAQERVLAFDPSAMTLTKTTIASNQLSASVTFLFGRGKLADEFSIQTVPCAKCSNVKGTLLELKPLRPDPRFQRIVLEIDKDTAQVLVSTVIDPDGSSNRIEFQKFKANTGAKESDFKLDVPAGTQIVDLSKLHP